jgi:hypothetical protein
MLDKKTGTETGTRQVLRTMRSAFIGPTVGLTKFQTEGLIVMHPAIVERKTTK